MGRLWNKFKQFGGKAASLGKKISGKVRQYAPAVAKFANTGAIKTLGNKAGEYIGIKNAGDRVAKGASTVAQGAQQYIKKGGGLNTSAAGSSIRQAIKRKAGDQNYGLASDSISAGKKLINSFR